MNDYPETLIETDDVRVRIMLLAVGQATAWHYHTEVTDKMLCLEGRIAVEFQKPAGSAELDSGEKCIVSSNRVHRVVNRADGPAKYLLVQGVGRYDFNVVE